MPTRTARERGGAGEARTGGEGSSAGGAGTYAHASRIAYAFDPERYTELMYFWACAISSGLNQS